MFKNRIEAGRLLASKLSNGIKNPIVIGLPRGGVVVGFELAKKLRVSLEVLVVRKIGSPNNPEFGIGAISENDTCYLDKDMVDILQIPDETIEVIKRREKVELKRRIQLYKGKKSFPLLTNKTVILVDDGIATGVSVRAALLSLKKYHPKKIIFCIPVCSADTKKLIRPLIDKLICFHTSEQLVSIGSYYLDFDQVDDKEVLSLLGKSKEIYTQSGIDNDFRYNIIW